MTRGPRAGALGQAVFMWTLLARQLFLQHAHRPRARSADAKRPERGGRLACSWFS